MNNSMPQDRDGLSTVKIRSVYTTNVSTFYVFLHYIIWNSAATFIFKCQTSRVSENPSVQKKKSGATLRFFLQHPKSIHYKILNMKCIFFVKNCMYSKKKKKLLCKGMKPFFKVLFNNIKAQNRKNFCFEQKRQ